MTIEQFWSMVDDAHHEVGGNADVQSRRLVEALAKRPMEDVVAFSQWFKHRTKRAGTPGLLAAHFLIQDGQHSDDGFQYFRAWLIGRCRDAFGAAVADPESIAELLTDVADPMQQTNGEPLTYVATRAATAMLGEEAFDDDMALHDAMHAPPPGTAAGRIPASKDAPIQDAHAALRLPRLAARLDRLWSRQPERPSGIAASRQPDGSTVYYHPGTLRVAFALGADGRPIRGVGDVP